MSQTFKFWTHGVAVIPEETKEYTNTINGLFMKREGQGAKIKQKIGTDNWFHFAIPSATELIDSKKAVNYIQARLRVRINKDATIDKVHIWEASGPKTNITRIYYTEDPSIVPPFIPIVGQDTELDFNLIGKICKGPVVICVHVKFTGDNGEVVFTGAGVMFEVP